MMSKEECKTITEWKKKRYGSAFHISYWLINKSFVNECSETLFKHVKLRNNFF